MKKLLSLVIAMMMVFSASALAADEIVVGLNAEFPPFEYVEMDENGELRYEGIDIAISQRIAEALGCELRVENAEFSSILMGVATGVYDFGASGISITEERLDSMDFSDPYFLATQYIICAEDSGIESAEDLRDLQVAVIEGYTGETIVTEIMELPNVERYKKSTDALLELMNGRVDAVVIDSHTAIAMVAANADAGLMLVSDPAFETEEYAIAVQKGNEELLAVINEVLAEMLYADEENPVSEMDALVVLHTSAMTEEEAAE